MTSKKRGRNETDPIKVMKELFREWSRGCLNSDVTRKRLYCTAEYPPDAFSYCKGCEYRGQGR